MTKQNRASDSQARKDDPHLADCFAPRKKRRPTKKEKGTHRQEKETHRQEKETHKQEKATHNLPRAPVVSRPA